MPLSQSIVAMAFTCCSSVGKGIASPDSKITSSDCKITSFDSKITSFDSKIMSPDRKILGDFWGDSRSAPSGWWGKVHHYPGSLRCGHWRYLS